VPKRPETLDDLLAVALRDGHGLTEWCTENGLDPRTVWRLRNGKVAKPHLGTVSVLAAGLKLDLERVRAAIAASRAAAEKK
jgi:hypothetical protein